MITVGLTGGIGSGKSTVAKIFDVLQVPIYYADDAAKRLMNDDDMLRTALQATFGEAAYDEDGKLNRSYLANKVFNNQVMLDKLNSIVHPAVAADGIRWLAKHQHYPYAIKEAALLYEAGSYKQLDIMLCVVAPDALRIQRVMRRDGISKEAVLARMDKQWPPEQKAALADHTIVNDDVHALIPQVMAIHALLMRLADKKLKAE